jgi:hypothetical protein
VRRANSDPSELLPNQRPPGTIPATKGGPGPAPRATGSVGDGVTYDKQGGALSFHEARNRALEAAWKTPVAAAAPGEELILGPA